MLNFEQIKKIIPQRFPFLMIDRVLEVKKNKVVAIKNVTGNEIFFLGHFPQKAIMPGAMVIEGMNQGAIIAWHYVNANIKRKGKKQLTFFVGSVKVRFFSPVYPGDTIRYEIETIKNTPKRGFFEARAYVSDKLVSKAELVVSVKK